MAKRLDTDAVINEQLTGGRVSAPNVDRTGWSRAEVPTGLEDNYFINDLSTHIPQHVVKHAEKFGYILRWVSTARANPNERIYHYQKLGGILISSGMLADIAPEWLKTLQRFDFREGDFSRDAVDTQSGVSIGSLVLMGIPVVVRQKRQEHARRLQAQAQAQAERKYTTMDATNEVKVSKSDVEFSQFKRSTKPNSSEE